MMRRRNIIPDDKSLKQPIQYFEEGSFWTFLIFVIALNINDLLPFLKLTRKFKNEFTGLSFFAFLVSLFGLIIANYLRERVPTINVEKMKFKSRLLAYKIRNCFNVSTLINNLGFENETKFGFEMPVIRVFVNDSCSGGWVAIENMSNYNKLSRDDMIQNLSGVLKSKGVQRFSFVSSGLSKDGNFMIYQFEDMVSSQRLIVKDGNIKPFVSKDSNDVRLAKDLVWHSAMSAHLAIVGRTRSGKTMFCGSYLIPLFLAQGWEIAFYSTKNDKYVREFNGEFEPQKIILALENWVKIMKDRADKIAKAGKDSYLDMPNMKHIGIIIDEISNLNAQVSEDRMLKERWKNVSKILTSSGASSGISIVACSQYGSLEGFLPTSTAVTNVQDAVIILGLAADNGKDRQYLMAGFDLEHRNYKCGQGIGRFVYSGEKWEQPHFYETPLIVDDVFRSPRQT